MKGRTKCSVAQKEEQDKKKRLKSEGQNKIKGRTK